MAAGTTHDAMPEPPGASPHPDMVWIPGGRFLMGSERFYPEEAPVRESAVGGFWMDARPVTVVEFQRFVRQTGHVTVAERTPDPADYPGIDEALLVPGSAVFHATPGPVDLDDPGNWWTYLPGASWKRPFGPGSSITGCRTHPVVHVAWDDVVAYARWAGKAIPTEAEWERAARGGLEQASFAWGDEHFPGGRPMANTWQGEFPWQHLSIDGYESTSPVGSFPPNRYGLYDITGNVWEWTATPFDPPRDAGEAKPCCAPPEPQPPEEWFPRQVIKGGSHLCAPNYCLRYRPAARQGQSVETSMGHLGFRCIVRA